MAGRRAHGSAAPVLPPSFVRISPPFRFSVLLLEQPPDAFEFLVVQLALRMGLLERFEQVVRGIGFLLFVDLGMDREHDRYDAQ
jgi:hypothetical protein